MSADSLNYPFDTKDILRKRKSIRAELSCRPGLVEVKIAILGGSTTSEIRGIAELFLLKAGLRPTFYESEYGKYCEDVLVDDGALRAFAPDVAFIHTTQVNIVNAPRLFDSEQQVDAALEAEMAPYRAIWAKLSEQFSCLVIQNNFDLPPSRSLGALDATESFGRTNFLMRLNLEFASAARTNRQLLINDIHYMSAQLGLDRWFDRDYWFSYKMAVSHCGTVHLAHGLARLLGAAYGKSRKCLVLDLDNTLWGGVIGDDGMQGIRLGRESAQGEAFMAFQQYCRELNERGVLLAVCSKNESAHAREGFAHPDTVLKLENFTSFHANWDPKPGNIERIATDINIGLDSLVFVDDNPAERALVAAQLPQVAVPAVGSEVARFVEFIDREGYFEATSLNRDDAGRAAFYAGNEERAVFQGQFADYGAFLASLAMKAEIGLASPAYLERIAQLSNKTNQFNLTTRRYTLADVQTMAGDPSMIVLYGRLADRFGDNGLVTVVSGKLAAGIVHIDLWLMSCRVLKREMEHAMLDALAARALEHGAHAIVGYFHRTAKNDMVAEHFGRLGFAPVSRAVDGDASVWRLDLADYIQRNQHIKEIHYV